MKIHEHQAKTILRPYGVATPLGKAVTTAPEAREAADEIVRETGDETLVVKAQIHAGGRGKGRFLSDPELGGVRVVKGVEAARSMAEQMLGQVLVTHQTGPEGKRVGCVLIEQGAQIARELYVGMTLDRARGRVAIMASTEGGTEIEEVAARSPEKILRVLIDPQTGFYPHQARQLVYGLGLEGDVAKGATRFISALARAYHELDFSLAEINPLVVTAGGEVLALDAKVNLDSGALFRHKDLAALRDET